MLIALVALAGCDVIWSDGGQSGTEIPDHCVEVSRAPVEDPSTPAGGLSYSAAELLAATDGAWTGLFTPAVGEPVEAGATITSDPDGIEVVTQELVTGNGLAEGPPVDCGSAYAVRATVDLWTVDGLIDASFETTLAASGPSDASFGASIAGGGTTAPTAYDPADWDHSDLVFDGWLSGGALDVSVLWSGWDEEPESTDNGDGSGTIEPSGMSEGVGAFALGR